uniref:Uncharacterized protein n=1 Tax=Rhizophora mucronata TaxID=61149 RepID=A0A2P2KWY5_RHIMU
MLMDESTTPEQHRVPTHNIVQSCLYLPCN